MGAVIRGTSTYDNFLEGFTPEGTVRGTFPLKRRVLVREQCENYGEKLSFFHLAVYCKKLTNEIKFQTPYSQEPNEKSP